MNDSSSLEAITERKKQTEIMLNGEINHLKLCLNNNEKKYNEVLKNLEHAKR